MRHIFDLPAPVNRQRHEGAQGLSPTPSCQRSTGWIMDTVTSRLWHARRFPTQSEEPLRCGSAAVAVVAFSETHASPGILGLCSQRCRGNIDLCCLGSAVPWVLLLPGQQCALGVVCVPLEVWASLYIIKDGDLESLQMLVGLCSLCLCSECTQKNQISIIPCMKLKCRSRIHQNLSNVCKCNMSPG